MIDYTIYDLHTIEQSNNIDIRIDDTIYISHYIDAHQRFDSPDTTLSTIPSHTMTTIIQVISSVNSMRDIGTNIKMCLHHTCTYLLSFIVCVSGLSYTLHDLCTRGIARLHTTGIVLMVSMTISVGLYARCSMYVRQHRLRQMHHRKRRIVDIVKDNDRYYRSCRVYVSPHASYIYFIAC